MNNADVLKGNPEWHAGMQFYELLFLYFQDIKIGMQSRDISAVIINYQEMVLLVYPYIERHMSDADISLFDNDDDIEELQGKLKPENTSHEIDYNNQIMNQILSIITKKRRRLSKLMAKAKLMLPLSKDRSHLPAVLDGDDFVNE